MTQFLPAPSRRHALLAMVSAPLIAAPTIARAQTVPVKVGFVPVIGAASLFVLEQAGWARDAGLALTTTKFDSGPAAIQAFASGSFDVLAIGVAPVAVARAKGLDASVVAAAGVGGSAFVAGPDLVARFALTDLNPTAAFTVFHRERGRPARIATLPPGAVPTVALNHWLYQVNKVNPSDVEIVTIGIEAAQQAMLAGAVDGATLLEPSVTIVQARNPKLSTIATALDMFPGIPGVVFAVSKRFLVQQREAVVSLLRLHARATRLIVEKPAEAAPHVAKVLGGGLVDPALMMRAMTSKAISYVADPRAIIEPTKRLLAYETTLGDFAQAPPTEGLFDLSVWDEAMK